MKGNKIRKVFIVVMILILVTPVLYRKFIKPTLPVSSADRAAVRIMPLPAKMSLKKGKLILPAEFEFRVNCYDHNELIEKALQRFAYRMEKLVLPGKHGMQSIPLEIYCGRTQTDSLFSPEKESYKLVIRSRKIIIRAGGYQGVLNGLETILQLVTYGTDGTFVPAAVIRDRPRYPWRGLMIDVCRHWIPVDVILRNIDAMAAVKLNVLHLHLTEYQAFRIESKVFPLLQEKGSDGNYFTQEDIRKIVRYAGDRGIRVVPEFDLPGHSTSWFAGYPGLATFPGPYVPDTSFGVLYPVFDPTREEVYEFLDRFFGEMASLFPDPYVHIGGDEVNPEQWNQSEHVQQFMKDNDLDDTGALQACFNKRLEEILAAHGKKMMGWDEILYPGLPEDIVVQSWRNQKSLFEAVRRGGNAVLSAGYYLDHQLPAGKHYSVDPEIIPGAVNIEPDSLHWKTYNITMDAAGNVMDGSLTLYGLPENLRGFVSFMGGRIAFPEAEMQDGNLVFPIHTDYGRIIFRLSPLGDSISGKGSLGVLGIRVHGKLTGSNDLPGTVPPALERMEPLTPQEKMRILGGEACMWSELVDSVTIESRIWPRTAAIAEKLWTPALLTKDTEDMYRRLRAADRFLTRMGLQHHANYIRQLHALAGGKDISDLKAFTDLLEEVKYYDRMGIYQNLTVHTPLNKVVDAVWPESLPARDFNILAGRYVQDPADRALRDSLILRLNAWSNVDRLLTSLADRSEEVAQVFPLARLLAGMSSAGMLLMENPSDRELPPDIVKQLDSLTNVAVNPVAGVLLAVNPGFRKLADYFGNVN